MTLLLLALLTAQAAAPPAAPPGAQPGAQPADTLVVGSGLSAEESTELRGACAARFGCIDEQRRAAILADAATFGLTCEGDDAACWRRLLAVAAVRRAIVVSVIDDDVHVMVVESEAPALSARGARALGVDAVLGRALDPAAQLPAAREQVAKAPPPIATPAPDAPAPAAPPTDEPPAGPPSAPASTLPLWAVSGTSVAVSLAAGAGAALVSADLAASMEAAAAGEQPLVAYGLRNGLFFGLAGASVVALAAALGTAAMALIAEP